MAPIFDTADERPLAIDLFCGLGGWTEGLLAAMFFEDNCDQSEDWPYCECQNETDEEEDAFNVCKSCGKPLT